MGPGLIAIDLAAHVELGAFLDQDPGFVAQIVFAHDLRAGAGVEQGAGRQLESADVFGSDGDGALFGVGAFVDGDGVGRGMRAEAQVLVRVSGLQRGAFRPHCLRCLRGCNWSWSGLSACRWRWCCRHGGDGRNGFGYRALPDAGATGRNRFFRCSGGALEGGNLVDRIGLRYALLHAEEGGETARARCRHLGHRFGNIVNRPGEQPLRGTGLGLLGKPLLQFALAFGALFAPVAVAIVPGDEVEPAIFDLRLEGPEVDIGGEVDADTCQGRSYEPCSLGVQVDDEHAGNDTAHHAFNGNGVQPVPMPWQEAEDCGQEDDSQRGAHPAKDGRAAGARADPVPAESADPEREEEDGDPEGLEKDVAEVGAEEADPIVDCVGRDPRPRRC